MVEARDFPSFLRPRLRRGIRLGVHHVSTRPSPAPPLYAPGPGQSEESTTVESHFLALSQPGQTPINPSDSASDVIVLGIEVLIFTTQTLTTVFVSKADSTGLLTKPAGHASRGTSLAQVAITAFLEFLVLPRLPKTRLVLSLFARAQNQYLFPGSIENETKHVLDDRQLIKWWCRVLDPVARHGSLSESSSVRAHVVVPGCDKADTKAFFPPSARLDPASRPLWLNAYPSDLLVVDTSLPPRCLVPRLPDDPKSRFLDDLDGQGIENGHWRSVKTLDQFWELMSYRQECSAGRLVGFVWIVFTTNAISPATVSQDSSRAPLQDTHGPPKLAEATTLAPTEQSGTASVASTVSRESVIDKVPAAEDSNISSSVPVSSTQPMLETGSSHGKVQNVLPTTQADSSTGSQTTPLVSVAREATDLTADEYQALMDLMLELDFAGIEPATQSTRTWREKVQMICNVPAFGLEIEGQRDDMEEKAAEKSVPPATTVNTLTAVRKKRKAGSVDTNGTEAVADKTMINTLATNLVRKKSRA